MTTKRINPYQRLKKVALEWASKVLYPETKGMWVYPKSELSKEWDLSDLYHRTAAAQQLGYKVVLKAKKEGLCVFYVKDVPSLPWELR